MVQHQDHQQHSSQSEHVGHYEHQEQLADAREDLDHARHQEPHHHHDKHAGHSPEIFQRSFFICLLLGLPVLYFSTSFQDWFNYRAIQFPGDFWIVPILSTIIYFYGGWVFLRGAWRELHSRIGMMTLIALAITVAHNTACECK